MESSPSSGSENRSANQRESRKNHLLGLFLDTAQKNHEKNPGLLSVSVELPTVEPLRTEIPCPLCQTKIELIGIAPQKVICPDCELSCTLTPPLPQPTAEPKLAESEPQPAPLNDFESWLAGEPIKVKPTGQERLLKEWISIHPNQAASLAASIALLMIGVIFALLAYGSASLSLVQIEDEMKGLSSRESKARVKLDHELFNERQLRNQVETNFRQAQKTVRQQYARHLVHRSQEAIKQNRQEGMLLAIEALNISLETGDSPITDAHQNIRNLLGDQTNIVLRGHIDTISSIAVSHDSHWLASGGADHSIRLWDLTSDDPAKSPLLLVGHSGKISAMVFSSDNRWLVTGSFDATARLWDLSKSDPTKSSWVLRGQTGRISSLALSPDNRWLVAGGVNTLSEEGTIRLWDLSTENDNNISLEAHVHSGSVHVTTISPDNRWLLTGGDDSTPRIWKLNSDYPLGEATILPGLKDSVRCATFTPDRRWLAVGEWSYPSTGNTVSLWRCDQEITQDRIELFGHQGGIRSIAASSDSRWLVTAGDDKTARVWDLQKENPAKDPIVLKGHSKPVHFTAFTPNNRWLVTASEDGTARLWSLGSEGPNLSSVVLKGHRGRIVQMMVSPDSRWVITAGEDNLLRLWHLEIDHLASLARAVVDARSDRLSTLPKELQSSPPEPVNILKPYVARKSQKTVE